MESISLHLNEYIHRNAEVKHLNDFFVTEFKQRPDNILSVILQDLRTSQSDLRYIFKTFETNEHAIDWYYSEHGYLNNYSRYFHQIMGSCQQPIEIVRYLPILAPWSYARNFTSTEMGKVPESFADKQQLIRLVKKIIHSKALKKLKQIKDYDHNTKKFHKEHPEHKDANFGCFFEKSRILKKLISSSIKKQITFKLVGRDYWVEPMCNPFTNKIVFKIGSVADDLVFILKISPYNIEHIQTDHAAKTKENQMLRGDSPYLNAMVDFYLKLNHCEHAANIVYYNYEYDFVLYAADEGNETDFDDATCRHLYQFNRQHLSDANKLGIYMNDINNGNFLKTNRGRLVIIDSGHVSYCNPANPGVPGATTNLSNLCGRSLIESFGACGLPAPLS